MFLSCYHGKGKVSYGIKDTKASASRLAGVHLETAGCRRWLGLGPGPGLGPAVTGGAAAVSRDWSPLIIATSCQMEGADGDNNLHVKCPV